MEPQVVFPNLNIQINILPRVAFSIFGLPIYWYGVIMVSAIMVGYLSAMYFGKKYGENTELYSDFLVFALIVSVICARAYYVIFSWDYYKHNLIKIFAFREGGLALYGSLIGAALSAFLFTRYKKMDFFKFCDIAAPAFCIGQVVGRFGNFVNREAFGTFTNNIFAMRYIKDQVDYVPASVLEQLVTVNGVEYIQVHPTFLYESLWNFALYFILIFYAKRKKFDGEVMFLYLLGYGLGRAWIEGLRTDQLLLFGTGLYVSQVLSVLLAISSFVVIFAVRRFKDRAKA